MTGEFQDGQERQGLEAQDQDQGQDPPGPGVHVLHDPELVLHRPVAQQPVGRIPQSVQVKPSGQDHQDRGVQSGPKGQGIDRLSGQEIEQGPDQTDQEAHHRVPPQLVRTPGRVLSGRKHGQES